MTARQESKLARSNNPALVEAAVTGLLRSEDEVLRAFALRVAFRQVRSLVARLEPPAPATTESQAVVQACGNAVQYVIENYSYEKAGFEVRGQDHAGVGNVPGNTVSITFDYGCSFSGRLDGMARSSDLSARPARRTLSRRA